MKALVWSCVVGLVVLACAVAMQGLLLEAGLLCLMAAAVAADQL